MKERGEKKLSKDIVQKHAENTSDKAIKLVWVIWLVALVLAATAGVVFSFQSDQNSAFLAFFCLVFLSLLFLPMIILYRFRSDILETLEENKQSIFEQQHTLNNQQQIIKEELHSYLMTGSIGIDPNVIPLYRFIPLRTYIQEEYQADIARIIKCLVSFADALGIMISDEFPAEYGSWFKKWFGKTKELLTRDEVLERLRKAERAIELSTLQIKQSEVDRNQAEAASKLLQSIEHVPNAICQIGSIVIVKVTSENGPQVFTRTLTPGEMMYLEQRPYLFKSPVTLLEAIDGFRREKRAAGELNE